MKRVWSLLSAVAFALNVVALPRLATAAPPCSSQGKNVNLDGAWKDPRGHRVTISQTGFQIVLTAPSGRVLSGRLQGTKLDLEGRFHGYEVSNAPPDVQAAIEARNLKVKFSGQIDAGSACRMSASEDLPDDIQWNGDHKITNISRLGHRVTLTKVEKIRIVRLDEHIEEAIRQIKVPLRDRMNELQRTKAAIAANLPDVQARHDAAKADYERATSDRVALRTQMGAIVDRIKAIASRPPIVPQDARAVYNQKIALERENDRLWSLAPGQPKATADEMYERIATNQDKIGTLEQLIAGRVKYPANDLAALNRLAGQYDALDAKDLDAEKRAAHALAAMETTDVVLADAAQRSLDVDTQMDQVGEQIVQLEASMDAVDATANGAAVFRAEATGTPDELKKLDAALAKMRASLAVLDGARQDAKKAFFDATQEAIKAYDAYAEVAWRNAKAKFAIDLGFHAWELTMAGVEGGPFGIFAEGAKKIAETAAQNFVEDVLGSPTGIAPGSIEDQIAKEYGIKFKDAAAVSVIAKPAIERSVKIMVTGPVLKQAIIQNRVIPWVLDSGHAIAYKAMAKLIVSVDASNGTIAKIAGILARDRVSIDATKALIVKEVSLQKIFDLKMKAGQKTPKFFDSIARDALKYALKAGLDAQEHDLFVDAYLKDGFARSLYPLYRVGTETYWNLLEGQGQYQGRGYKDFLTERDKLLDGYDPLTGFRTTLSKEFDNDSEIVLTLHVRQPSGAAAIPFKVDVGGVACSQGTGYSFSANTSQAVARPDGGVTVTVK